MSNNQGLKFTINQILSAFGEKVVDDNLHIMYQNETLSELPVNLPFRLDHYCIILVQAGTCEIKYDLISYTHQKNDLIIITPNIVNEFISVSDDYRFTLLSFSAVFPIRLGVNQQHVDSFSFFTRQRISLLSLTSAEMAIISEIVHILYQKNSLKFHPFKNELILHAYSLLMFEISALLKVYYKVKRNQISRKEEHSLRFLKYLSQYVTVERSVQFYALKMGVTADYLTKLTKSTLHKTAGDFIDEMVIQEAKILLQQSALSIGQIADKLSFKDQFQFSKFFKNKTTLTPSAYRNVGS